MVAQDAAAFKALEALAPGHVVLAAQPLPEEDGYASPGTKHMRKVAPRILAVSVPRSGFPQMPLS